MYELPVFMSKTTCELITHAYLHVGYDDMMWLFKVFQPFYTYMNIQCTAV